MHLPIYLIGYMAAGKTTVGRLLAERLGWRFVDLDEAFAEIHGKTPAEYIREYGIEEFRYKEKYVVEDMLRAAAIHAGRIIWSASRNWVRVSISSGNPSIWLNGLCSRT